MAEANTTSVLGRDLPISTKDSVEICNFIRHKNLERAKRQLDLVLEKKLAIPMRRFNDSRGHRKGRIGPGAFPEKATKEILGLLNTLEANARDKGLSNSDLYLTKVVANQAARPMHAGRHRGTVMKRTHVEMIAIEKVIKKESKKQPSLEKKPEEEKQTKPVEKKIEDKPKEVEKKK